jgi:hypothetical protein
VSVEGTNAETLGVVSNVPEAGKLMVAVYGAVPVGGDGVFVNLTFDVKGAAGSSSPLRLSGFRFNADTDAVTSTDGLVTVNAASNAATLSGRLFSGTGRGVGRATVQIAGPAGVMTTSVTGKNGRFSFAGLTRGETYTLTVRTRRFQSARTRSRSQTVPLTCSSWPCRSLESGMVRCTRPAPFLYY